MAMMGYLQENIRCLAGRVSLNDRVLLMPGNNHASLRTRVWGKIIALIPQNAGTALNPALRIYDQINESLTLHTALNQCEKTATNLRFMD